jgi:hypothetical protein
MSFSDYKRMHWVVCKTCRMSREDIGRRVREIFRVCLRKESEQQRGHVFRGKWAQFLRKNLVKIFFCCGRPYCTNPYSPYGFGTEIEAILGTVFKAIFRFSMVVFGPYKTVRTADCGYGRGWTAVRFRHEKRGRFLWDRFGAVRYFPWLEMLFCC